MAFMTPPPVVGSAAAKKKKKKKRGIFWRVRPFSGFEPSYASMPAEDSADATSERAPATMSEAAVPSFVAIEKIVDDECEKEEKPERGRKEKKKSKKQDVDGEEAPAGPAESAISPTPLATAASCELDDILGVPSPETYKANVADEADKAYESPWIQVYDDDDDLIFDEGGDYEYDDAPSCTSSAYMSYDPAATPDRPACKTHGEDKRVDARQRSGGTARTADFSLVSDLTDRTWGRPGGDGVDDGARRPVARETFREKGRKARRRYREDEDEDGLPFRPLGGARPGLSLLQRLLACGVPGCGPV